MSFIDTDGLCRPTPIHRNSPVGSFLEILRSKDPEQDLSRITNPMERGILVGEAVFGLLKSGNSLGHPLIMIAEADENNRLEVSAEDEINIGIAIGLQIETPAPTALVVASTLREISPLPEIQVVTSDIRSLADYTPVEYAAMQTDHDDLRDVFPVPEVAIRFDVSRTSSVSRA